jgi:hypothetical protein
VKPEVDQILNLSAGQLMAGTVPLLPNSFAQGSTGLVGILMLLSAQEYERGADIRARENADMRTLFKELSPHVGDKELKAKLEEAAASSDASLLISALDRSNAHLRKLLIAVHAYLEEQDGDAARAGEKRIWDVLRASAERRFLKPPGA